MWSHAEEVMGSSPSERGDNLVFKPSPTRILPLKTPRLFPGGSSNQARSAATSECIVAHHEQAAVVQSARCAVSTRMSSLFRSPVSPFSPIVVRCERGVNGRSALCKLTQRQTAASVVMEACLHEHLK